MPPQIKIALIAFAVIAVFGAGFYTKGEFDKADQEKVLAAQIEASNKAQKEIAAKASEAEVSLAAERKKTANLNKKWSAYRATNHINCELSDDVRGLLHDATVTDNIVPR